jgi:hypothetical protein
MPREILILLREKWFITAAANIAAPYLFKILLPFLIMLVFASISLAQQKRFTEGEKI